MIEYIQGKQSDTGIFIVWLPDNKPVQWGALMEQREGWWMHWSPERVGFGHVDISFQKAPTKRMWVMIERSLYLPTVKFNNGVPCVDGLDMLDQMVLENMVTRARRIKNIDRAFKATGPYPVKL